MTQDMNHTIVKTLQAMLVVIMMLLTGSHALAQTGVTVGGSVFGGGNEADVKVNTEVNITSSTCEISGNVYGGGNVGSVGTYTTSEDMKTFTFIAKTGICNVTINGGTIGTGVERSSDGTFADGNVYGAGKGEADTYWCEKAMVYKTNVAINAGTIRGTVYGGGQIGRVENDATVTIGAANPTDNTVTPTITGNVFGAGAGLQTHGYSALLRGNTKVTVQGYSQVGLSVYGGGEKASVGRFKIVGGLPSEPQDGGTCEVTVNGHAKIGTSGTEHNVFGSCQGVAAPASMTAYDKTYKSMQTWENRPAGAENTAWEYIKEYEQDYKGQKYIWEYYASKDAYQGFLHTLALASHTDVEINGSASVYGSVFGGGQNGITLGNVAVDIKGGTVYDDVYGGGALADTNKGNQTAEKYDVATVIVDETDVAGMYERSGAGTAQSPYVYTATEDTKAVDGKTYYIRASQSSINTTTLNLTGGLIKGDAYGGGLGQKTGFNSASSDIAAVVHGDIAVTLNGTAFEITKYTDEGYTNVVKSARVFGCNNLLGSPQGNVTVTVNKTVSLDAQGAVKTKPTRKTNAYELAAVYGGGNLAPYTATGKKTHVIIHGCSDTSIETVYGGGNAAAVPETAVDIYSAYEIGALFGGGNGKDKYKNDNGWQTNPGADVNGNANTLIYGGTVHEAYGGSNEKGTITGNVTIDVAGTNPEACTLDVEKLVGAGKNADVNGDLIMIMGCKTNAKIPLLFAGADNANVKGNVELTITSGNFGKVFGGNNDGGAIFGHIKLNIEETSDCEPIRIDELYLGGNNAAYSRYGYYQDGADTNGKPIYQPRTAAMHAITDTNNGNYKAPVNNPDADATHTFPYAQPVLNIISCTSIGQVFGGGYGKDAVMHADPTVNINMIQGNNYSNITATTSNPNQLGVIGDVFGGGNAAAVIGNPTVNIGTATTVTLTSIDDDPNTTEVNESQKTVLGAYISRDVFGGGNAADVTGNTQVNICAVVDDDPTTTDVIEYASVDLGTGVTIEGTQPATGFGRGVFGGGNQGHVYGDSFVYMGGGAVNQTVYGGGCEADVKGNTHVTMLNGYVNDGVCGGGLSGSVGTITSRSALPTGHSHEEGETCVGGKPDGFETNTGKCTVVITGGQVGPLEVATVGMGTANHPVPISEGWVWGASRGVVVDPSSDPDSDFKTYVYETDVTIGGTAFILEGVVGGGEFGHVRGNTLVKIQDQCQIGVGENSTVTVSGVEKPLRYSEEQWEAAETAVREADVTAINNAAEAMPACSHFPYGRNDGTEQDPDWVYDTYDPYADQYHHPYPGGSTANASDGKTWIGCVFGGGSGYMPYENKDGNGYNWDPVAGLVEGNSEVRISGGHILTCVYGGNEVTSVTGQSKVTMTGGTIGVPRKKDDLKNNPMIGNLFGAGKGDPRSAFNGLTNVGSAKVEISGGIIFGSVYGGSEDGHVEGNVIVKIEKNEDTSIPIPVIGTWGASYIDGNVYGGGMGTTSNILAGLIKGNTKVDISDGIILHNIYGGGAYGSVGEFVYDTNTGLPTGRKANTTGGKAEILITGGTIGTNGHENGMVFGSSRGDVGAPGEIHDKLAWVYDTEVTIGTSDQGTTLTTPLIKGSIYGSGENGHTFNDAKVTVHSGTIGITDTSIDGGAAYLYRGNVYGGGCGTDMYDSDNDGTEDSYNPLAGIVYGNATVNITGGRVVHNVYGAGAMGSVGFFEKDATTNAITYTSGGTTTIAISGGIIGVDGTAEEGNVFGAARGDETTTQTDVALVKTTDVTVSGDATIVWGNVYGGGQIGCVGTFAERAADGKYIWTSDDQNLNGLSKVTITGGETKGHVFGAGKGKANTFKCEKAMVRETIVSVSNGQVGGNVYGGGEIGRVEENTEVKIGVGDGTCKPTILGSVYGAGAGSETHGYSALVRGNTKVTVEGGASIGHSVYGGGEIASVGRYGLDEHKMPEILLDGGYCYVKVQGSATIGSTTVEGNVFGACKGVDPHLDKTNADRSKRSRRMTVYTNATDFPDGAKISAETGTASGITPNGTTWEYYDENVTPKLVWEYFQDEDGYNKYLETLALATHPEVTIDGGVTVNGSVYGGGEMGLTKGSVIVNIQGGTITEDVYGGGALANTNTTSAVGELNNDGTPKKDGNNYVTTTVNPTTKVYLLGGSLRDAYGGGLGRKEYGTSGQPGYVSPIEAKVYGDVLVELNGKAETGRIADDSKGCIVNRVFGCNNLNGSPQKHVKVHVYATQNPDASKNTIAKANKPTLNTNTYEVAAVYGGGNLAAYEPADALLDYEANKATVDAARTEVIIDGCELTSIKQVYGGGNAASVPATFVEINGTYEIDEVFGGGNGADDYSLMEGNEKVYYKNCGANVGYYNYANYPKTGTGAGNGTSGSPWVAVDDSNFDTKEERLPDPDTHEAAAMRYGSGIARLEVYGGTIHTSYGGSNSRGNVRAKLSSVYSANGGCDMKVATSYGGGKDAVSDGIVDMLADCAHGIKEMFGGSMNADVDNDINLTITNGSTLERVFGGNNTSGAINGSITVTIDESGCEPIRIDNLYLGGFLAPYSVYGYKKKQDGSYEYINKTDEKGNAIQERIPLMKGEDGALTTPRKDPCLYVISATHIGNIFGGGYKAKLVGNPHVNVNMKQGKVLLTRTGTEGAYIYKDAVGKTYTEYEEVGGKYYATLPVGEIGNVYGGGNMADIIGDTFVEIGTGTWHNANGVLETLGTDGRTYTYNETTKKWSYVTTAGEGEGQTSQTVVAETAPTPARNAANITGNVFGGGKGFEDSFTCEKAMVNSAVVNDVDQGGGNTSVIIGNGTIGGTVYGGGQIGRVEHNTTVTIGLESGTDEPVIGLKTGSDEPVIEGNVFGAGRGVHTHGYAALVRGNTTVTVQGEAKVRKSVYGGGEIASVGKYNIATAAYHNEHPEVLEGMPYSLVSDNRGVCNVIVKGNAVIGPEGSMEMKKATGGPDVIGHVFGAGKGVLPYHDIDGNIISGDPWRMKPGDDEHPTGITETFNEETFSEAYYTELYGADYNKKLYNYLADYLRFIETLALTTKTEVTIGGNAFVKGSVYGGSENGHVQHDTHVTIRDFCQIGHSKGVSNRFTEDQWTNEDATIKACASWDYVPTEGAPYDPLATSEGTYDYTNYPFVPTADRTSRPTSDGGKPTATDGHTFYGNVFGGGSGLIPYAPGKWHREAGSVGGNTKVDIIGGHIMTSVYGGNEQTDVGTYILDPNNDYQPTIPKSGGKCTINMTGGTVGVPRTKEQIEALPLICNVFGAGKGDQRIFFNTWTNVIETEVNISGTARIYGSTFGGGEDGHVIGNAKTNIGGTVTIGTQNYNHSNVIIGSVGTSYMDGNVFGGGRGFSGEAQTAGTVGGNAEVNIENGKIYGSVYGGGRLASVGTMFDFPTLSNGDPNPAYGQFKEDETGVNAKTYGHVTVNISGGSIGRDFSTLTTLPDGAEHSGNVFGGSMGRLELLNGTRNPIWPKMAQVKETNVNIYGTAVVRRSVYGGGELGTVRENAYVTIGGQKTADADNDGNVGVTSSDSDSPTVRRDVFGGGYGSEDMNYTIFTIPELKSATDDPNDPDSYESHTYAFTPMQFAGCVGKNTYVNVVGGYIRKSVYGGGELASVGVINYRAKDTTTEPAADKVKIGPIDGKTYYYEYMVKHGDATNGFALSWPYKFIYVDGYDGTTHVNITGGRLGLKDGDTDTGFDDNGDVYGAGKGEAGDYKEYVFCANVGSTNVVIDHASSNDLTAYSGTDDLIAGAVYGGGEDGHVMGNSKVTMKKGFVYHSIYGAGSGKGTFEATLVKIGKNPNSTLPADHYTREICSITAGKVFGNSTVEMSGGTVVRNVYGGGNMGSVGKGNYAGGTDDYSTNGYGEKVTNLWSNEDFLNSGICTVKITGGTIGYIDSADPSNTMYPWNSSASLPYGNVFGGCRGESAPNITETPRYLYSPEFFVGYANETSVEIGKDDGTGPTILGSVYGGGMDGHVRRDAEVIIKGGKIGIPYTTENQTLVKTSDLNNVQWLARGNVYGAGSGIGKYKYDFDYDGAYTSTVEYNGKQTKEEDNSTSAGSVTRFTKVEIKGGTIHRNVYGGGSLSTVGAPKIPVNNILPPDLYRKGDTAEGHGEGKQTLNEVIIAGGHIGDASSYDSNGNHKYGGHVYGGSRGSTDLDNSFSTAFYTAVNIIGDADVKGDVYGGGEAGTVKGTVDVNIAGGTIGHDVYGGGALADTQTSNWNATAGDWVDAEKKSALYQTKVNILGGTISGDAYGGGLGRQEVGTNNQPGYVAPVEAKVYGDVYVNLNGFDQREVTYDPVTHGATGDATGARLVIDNNEYLVKDDVKGAVVSRIFGCNNLNGSPQGSTKVHVFKTQNKNASRITNLAEGDQTAKVEERYDLEAVYGGGNMAAYEPRNAYSNDLALKNAAHTQVIIDGCDRTSIYQVYGGGNAASTPATDVEVLGTYEIFELFGGGNGADDLPDGSPNPGANVGYKDYHLVENNSEFATKEARVDGEAFAAYRYGTGVATVDVKGGTIHRVFGGSNTKGNVRQTALTLLEEESGCPFCVDEAYGGGKSAPMDAEAQLHMACIPGLKEAYGGAEAADIQGDVTLNITNGTFDRVFGGNNISGTIRGSITVNIEETGCKPIIIGELYGGGNQAGYSIYGYKEVTEGTNKVWRPRLPGDGLESGMTVANRDPEVNIRSFTSIGDVYGGGYGSSAEMVGSPTVNINVTEDATTEAQTYYKETVDDDGDESTPEVPVYVSNYAGGSVTLDEGLSTEHTVTLPSHEQGKMGAINNVFGGGNAAKVTGNTYVNIGTLDNVIFVTPTKKTVTTTVSGEEVTTEVLTTDEERTKTVKGADIRGNVYGGGNAAEVTGNTNVIVGQKKE